MKLVVPKNLQPPLNVHKRTVHVDEDTYRGIVKLSLESGHTYAMVLRILVAQATVEQ